MITPTEGLNILDLLVKARAQGVRELEVRSDGSFRAVMDPQPPAPPAPPPPGRELTPEEAERAQVDLDLQSAG